MAKLQNEIIAHQSSIDAMLDRLKKSEDIENWGVEPNFN